MLSTPKAKSGLFLASSLCDGLEDNNIRQVATLLLNKDADPNILIPTYGVTPFHLAIGNDSEEFAEEVTKLFLRHGGDPNVRSNDGMTPVHIAAAWGRINILELLLMNGGDPLHLDNDGRSPFHYAFDGKYFKVMTLLLKYCENIQEKDDKPKYNIELDKVLISNGDIIAEYVTSKNIEIDIDNVTRKTEPTDLDNFKLNSSMYIALDNANVCDINCSETECKLLRNINDHSFEINNMTTQTLNDHSQTISDKKATSNYSFIDLDFDFANLQLADVMQKEKHFVSQIIVCNSLSISLTNNCNINETLHKDKKIKQKEISIATSETDISFDTSFHNDYHKNSKDFSPTLKNTPSMKRWSKHDIESKKKSKKISNKISTYSLNDSIVSMSPNFKTPNQGKRKKIIKTPLTPSHIFNDSIISKSPNFATPVCAFSKRNLAKTSHVDDYFSSKMSKKSYEYESQYVEFNQCKKYIAQSTPRRKKRSIYKLRSARKIQLYHENNIISDEFTKNSLKPINLNKTIFSTEDITSSHNTVDSCSEYSSLYFQKPSEIKQQINQLTMQLNTEKIYNEDSIIHNSNLNLLNKIDLSNSFNQDKENEFINSFGSDKKYIKSDNNQINAEFTTRKNIFKTDKALGTINFINNKSACTIDSSQRENEDCIDCDIKKLLNEDLNININKTCKHEKNWCDDKFHENLSHNLTVENNPLTINLPTILANGKPAILANGKQVHLSDFQRSDSLKVDKSNSDSKRMENLFQGKDLNLNICKIEKSSSLSYISTQEEYKYEDPEEGVILLERRLCVTPFSTCGDSEYDIQSKMNRSGVSNASVCQNLPKELLIMGNVTLRKELKQLGDQPGPITSTTKQVYLKRLIHLRNVQNNKIPSVSQNFSKTSVISSNQIKPHLQLENWLKHLDTYKSLEKEVFQAFVSPDPTRKWREGTSKTSFTYLLLDSRVTQDLPNRSASLLESERWSIFLNAIFYIGKGTRSRPFAHLYDAFKVWKIQKIEKSISTNKKINRIVDIWNNDHGVISLHVFQNIISVEAYTREAMMIDAIGKEQLENCIGGKYYGIAATWSIQQKQKFGRYLLYKALQILMYEGESQLFPYHLFHNNKLNDDEGHMI